MDRGAWQATVHGVTRVGHDLVTKPPKPPPPYEFSQYSRNILSATSTYPRTLMYTK